MACVAIGVTQSAMAGIVSSGGKAVREIAEALAEQAGKKASKEFVETTAVQLENIAGKCGGESLDVISKHGLVAFRVFKNAGDDAGEYLVKAIRIYGDDALRIAQSSAGRSVLRSGSDAAIRAVARHSDAVVPLIQRYGDDGVAALVKLSPANGRRLLQMVDANTLPASRLRDVLATIGKYGDKSLEFVWKHRKVLTSAALLTAFISDPEPYLNGFKDITLGVIDTAVSPVAEGVGNGISMGMVKIFESIRWNLWIGVLFAILGIRQYIRHRKKSKTVALSKEDSQSVNEGESI
ncbi:MAG TPA: hypothetical protein DCS43_11365 [Verrucomicrobia bacterium]|nr:hypothetical protein [Verrucomicrobiota bacterium]